MSLRAVVSQDVAGIADTQIADAFENQHLVGQIKTYSKTVTFTELASAGQSVIVSGEAGKQFRVLGVRHGAGTNFSGGDRNLALSSNNSTGPIWGVLLAAYAQALNNKMWGDASSWSVNTSADGVSAAGDGIFVSYTGGATDYTAGEIKIIIEVERVA